ncbi:MAG: hypothetical protein J2P17_06160 [Mycobacterium sp.]|nr:hypothetical protein [Mycobacterium sp.]
MPSALCRCGLPVRRFLYNAMPLYLDDMPLTELGELDAVLNGVKTFSVYGSNLIRRTPAEIEQFPNPIGGQILREHRCRVPVPAVLTRQVDKRYAGDDPGF